MDAAGELLRMAEAFGLVAAVAVPAGLLAWAIGRRAGAVRLPEPAADDPVFALAYLILFLTHPVAVAVAGQSVTSGPVDAEHAAVQRSAVGSLVVAPLILAAWLAYRTTAAAGWSWRAAVRAIAFGIAGWLLASPVVYAAHGLAEAATRASGLSPSAHPLVEAAAAVRAAPWLTAASVTLATPFAEEVMFRGLLLGWLVRRPEWVWLPAGLGVLLAGLATTGSPAQGPAVGLATALAACLLAFRRWPAAGAVWSTATLFAAAHSNVWPTPVPLFALGLVLGAVAVRTGGVLAGTVMHGLFNAVSLVYLLRV